MAQKVYPKGIITFNPKDTQPQFVLGTIVISIDQLNDYFKNEGSEYVTEYKGAKQIKLQLTSLKDKRGISLSVDTFKYENKHSEAKENFAKREVVKDGQSDLDWKAEDDSSDLPF